jgi:hypothetical protein
VLRMTRPRGADFFTGQLKWAQKESRKREVWMRVKTPTGLRVRISRMTRRKWQQAALPPQIRKYHASVQLSTNIA